MSAVGMYFGIAIGCVSLVGVCGAILYHKYRQDLKAEQAVEQAVAQELQERLQQVAGVHPSLIFSQLLRAYLCKLW